MPINAYAQDFNRQDDSGSAFVLGKNEALDDLKDHVKGVLSDLARNRIQTQKALNDIGNVPLKGAMNSDLKEVLPSAKINLQKMTADYLQKQNTNPKFSTSDEGRKAYNSLRDAAINVDAMHTASANSRAEWDKAVTEFNTNPDKYDHDKAIAMMTEYSQSPPLSDIRMKPLVLPKKGMSYAKFLEQGEKIIPNNVIETPSENGLVSTTVKNKMFVNGKPTDYFLTKVQPKVESFLADTDGQEMIERVRKQNNFSDDEAGRQQAANIIRQDLYTSKDSEYKQTQKQEPQAEKKKAWQVNGNTLQNDKNIWHYDRNDNGEIFTMSHTDTSENKELEFKVFDKDKHVEEIKAVPTRIEYPKGATQPIIYATQTVKTTEPKDPDDPSQGTQVVEKQVERPVPYEFNAAKIENEYGKNPYQVRQEITGSLDQSGKVKTGKTGGAPKGGKADLKSAASLDEIIADYKLQHGGKAPDKATLKKITDLYNQK